MSAAEGSALPRTDVQDAVVPSENTQRLLAQVEERENVVQRRTLMRSIVSARGKTTALEKYSRLLVETQERARIAEKQSAAVEEAEDEAPSGLVRRSTSASLVSDEECNEVEFALYLANRGATDGPGAAQDAML